MYLTESIEDLEGMAAPGVGLVPGRSRMTKARVALGYHEGRALRSCPFVAEDDILRGHCYHWSRIEGLDESHAALELRKLGASASDIDGYCGDAVFASYLHIHFASHPELARAFVLACSRYASGAGAGKRAGAVAAAAAIELSTAAPAGRKL